MVGLSDTSFKNKMNDVLLLRIFQDADELIIMFSVVTGKSSKHDCTPNTTMIR